MKNLLEDFIIGLDQIAMTYNAGMTFLGDWQTITKHAANKECKVELGTAEGLTSILISRAGKRTYTIDENNDQTIARYLKRFGIKAIKGDTATTAKLFKQEVDFLFIDGDHSYEGVKRDFEAWFPKVKRKGVILIHDVSKVHGGVLRFYQELWGDGRLREIDKKPILNSVIKVFEKK